MQNKLSSLEQLRQKIGKPPQEPNTFFLLFVCACDHLEPMAIREMYIDQELSIGKDGLLIDEVEKVKEEYAKTPLTCVRISYETYVMYRRQFWDNGKR